MQMGCKIAGINGMQKKTNEEDKRKEKKYL